MVEGEKGGGRREKEERRKEGGGRENLNDASLHGVYVGLTLFTENSVHDFSLYK
jgi:hypothetical protein